MAETETQTDQDGNLPAMTLEQLSDYRIEIAKELHDLEFAQALKATDYKARRIRTLRQRLGLDKE